MIKSVFLGDILELYVWGRPERSKLPTCRVQQKLVGWSLGYFLGPLVEV